MWADKTKQVFQLHGVVPEREILAIFMKRHGHETLDRKNQELQDLLPVS